MNHLRSPLLFSLLIATVGALSSCTSGRDEPAASNSDALRANRQGVAAIFLRIPLKYGHPTYDLNEYQFGYIQGPLAGSEPDAPVPFSLEH
jgi:hypothetical protein